MTAATYTLYRELVLKHAKNPHNRRQSDPVTHSAERFNPVCGDHLSVYLGIDNDVIVDAGFDGQGCAISVASASMLTDAIRGRTVTDAQALAAKLERLLGGELFGDELGELGALSAVQAYPSRIQCATLAWHALKTATEPLTQHA